MTNQTNENETTTVAAEVKLTRKELKAQYAVEKEAAKEAGKTIDSWAQYTAAYDAQWDLAHPNDKDALKTDVNVDQVLKTVDDAAGAVAGAIVAVKAEGAPSKMSLAKAIFNAHLAAANGDGTKINRKAILAQFQLPASQGGADCTANGANTYYNTCRDKAGLVNHKS